ncbi:hypothetical protein HB904_13665 [Listeria booriae]|uniref:Type VII secretion system protein EssD-like domain-containing protein n=1 Tax=Listeria booriae TaxID=1552123 RepID=A0A841YM20_9LIST|nr:DNA/RNA non-specific endonuclease [Listeria booriae]MBC1400927.1 hypothetical protein [Listeria booriae]MBC1617248.1 hypothetical protein [Listeria booriae]
MDVKYKENEWNKSKDALKGLINSGWFSGKGVTDYLKDINRNFEDAQNDIRKDDPDGAISFSFTDKESSYQKMFEKMETLQDYAGEAGRLVERVIDEPFYKDIDKFVEKMEALSIEDYETNNTIGATTTITTSYGYGYGGAPQTTTVPKDKINLSDIMAGDNFFADNLKAQFAEYSKQNPDQEFTYEQYQSAVSSSRAFEYESIRDGQQNIEFWRDIGIAVVIIATSIVCPPAGLALGIAYGTLELSSAATGKDWLTGREMDAGERATRGAFALLDIIPGVKGLHAFSTATKAGGVALDAVQAGSKLTLKQAAKQGLSNLDAMGKQALRESAERIRNVPKVLKDTANTVKNTAQEGLTATKNMATNFGDNVRNLNFGQPRLVADGFGTVGTEFVKNADDVVSTASRSVRESASHIDDVPSVKEVPYGEHIVKGKNGRKELAPDTRYITEDNYKYTTDGSGRVERVEVDELVLKTADRNEGMQRIAGREDRLSDDDGGHLIASQFNGSGDIDNLVAQNSQINRSGGEWYSMEQEWADALKEVPPRKVSVKIEPSYPGSSLRPDSFRVTYQIEGERKVIREMLNRAGG